MNWEIKKNSVWPVIKISFLIFFLLFFLITLLYSTVLLNVIQTFGAMMTGMDIPAMPSGFPLIFISLFLSGIGALFYSVFISLGILIYNVLSVYVGGIRLEFSPLDKPNPGSSSTQHVSLASKQMIPGDYFTGIEETEEGKNEEDKSNE